FDDFAMDVVVNPTNANVVYATFGLRYTSGGIWKSADGGQTWSRLTNGLPNPSLPNLGYGRIELAMAPSNPNVLYASFAYLRKTGDTVNLPNYAMLGIWKTNNGGVSWTQVTTPLTSSQTNRNYGLMTALGSQGNYANAIVVHPADPNIVFVSGLDIYKSINGGNSWSQVSMWIRPGDENPEGIPYVHADHHVFAFDRSTNPPILYNGSDGGVARSRDLGVTWEILNKDLGVTQFYFFAVHPTNPGIMLGGTQDNGSLMLIHGGINDWFEFFTGDGGPSYFDFNDPATAYYSSYYVDMRRARFDYSTGRTISTENIGFTDGSNGITQEDVNGANFFAPFEMSPNNPNILVLGTYRVLKTTNQGNDWTPLSNRFSNKPIVAVAIAEGNDNIIWAATNDVLRSDEARVFKTENNGISWTEVTRPNLPNRFITDIEFDPSNPATVYLTYCGYGAPHVFKSTNAGASWTDITNNLPDTPANTMQVHPSNPTGFFSERTSGFFSAKTADKRGSLRRTIFPRCRWLQSS
ncbi:MAG: WD40/YVTN/BNR-like repeat-containing protein, partial [bacterium]